MRYAFDGSLTNYITKKFKNLKWKDKIEMLHNIILGLNIIHLRNLNVYHLNYLFQVIFRLRIVLSGKSISLPIKIDIKIYFIYFLFS